MPLEKYIIDQITTNSITTLDLSNKQIGDAEAKELAEALKDNHSITTINLYNNQIGDAGVKYLAEVLKDNQSITNLNLYSNKIGAAGAKDLAEALQINKSITTLNLYNNQIGAAGVKDLAETLKINQFITTLNLGCNQIEEAGEKHLAEVLAINKSITVLYLNWNKIGDAGVKYLAEVLKDNQSITVLYLTWNKIGDAGMKDLAEALKINPYITNLNLDGNQIGNAEAEDIAEALNINKDIYNLQQNQKGDVGAKVQLIQLKQLKQIQKESLKQAEKNSLLEESLKAAEKKLEAIVKAKQVKREAKDAKKEAERLEQEAKLKEQEEAKAAKEAARLKVLEEAKVKEYIPDIPVVKLFEVAGGDNQFDNDNQATIKEVSELIRDGNHRLQEHVEKGVLLLGNTGAGKSTLAHLFSGRKLQAIYNDETAELVIEAMYPLENIVIGHKSASETKIPNKCLAKDLIIWDCPGFNDTDPVQEIANSFYIKRLFETTKQLKFVLVVPESVLNIAIERGNIFLAALSNFIKSFKDIDSIEGSISLVVTHVPPNKNIHNIKTSIERILKDNQGATDKHKELINKLKSIHLFYKPTEEGELTVPDLLTAINASSKYSNAKGDMVNIAISKKAMECSSHLLNTGSNNFNQLLEVIVKAIADATNFNAFSENYTLIQDWVPSSSIHYNELKKHSEGEYFLKLELLSRLQEVLNCEQKSSISDAITILQRAVNIFAEYAESDSSPLQHQIQDYGYCLQQQYEYVKFFANVCGAKLPEHTKIAELITACHAKVTENLEYQVSNLNIDENQSDQEYYTKAIEYLENYKDSPACKTLKAIAYSCMASISEKNCGKESPLIYYAKAIEADSHLPTIYEKLGQIFFNNGKYAKAIDCYKVVNNEFRIEACFEAWLKQDQENPDIMLKQAEYFQSIGLFEKAKTYYHHASSLSKDDNFKAAAYKKIGNIMVNAVAQGQDFITKAEDYDFYNYDLVDKTFIDSLLVGEVDDSRYDLYC